MKKIYVILAGVLVSTLAIAREPGDGSKSTGLAVVKKNETTFNLFYKSTGLSNVKVSILNADGKEVFTEVIKKTDGFTRPYNLYKHPLGVYTIVVKNNERSLKESFSRSEETVLKAAHVVKLADNKYMLTVRSDMALGHVNVKIFDGSKLVHEQTNEISSDFGQIFTLKDIDQLITFEVTDSKGKKIN